MRTTRAASTIAAYCEHVYWLADKGTAGFVPFGTNGDGPTVATSEKTAVLEALVAADLRIS